MPDLQITEPEKKFIESIRKLKVEHGRIPCIIFIQDGKLIRVEFEKVIVSVIF